MYELGMTPGANFLLLFNSMKLLFILMINNLLDNKDGLLILLIFYLKFFVAPNPNVGSHA